MAKITKEQQLYLSGMQRALQIVKEHNVEELEKEVNYRCNYPLPIGVSRNELTVLARAHAKEELMIVATAMADTMSSDMKLPPSVILDYLRKFNKKVDLFRYDKDSLQKAQLKLDSMYALNETIRRFNNEEE